MEQCVLQCHWRYARHLPHLRADWVVARTRNVNTVKARCKVATAVPGGPSAPSLEQNRPRVGESQ